MMLVIADWKSLVVLDKGLHCISAAKSLNIPTREFR
jgi:hypothetical protein